MINKNFAFIMVFSLYLLLYGNSNGESKYKNFLPDLGDSDRGSLSIVEADFIGRQIIQDINKQDKMVNDYDTINYLNDIGGELASYSSLAGQVFNFYLIKDNVVNAFALPGGYICVYNGLIYTTDSEAELVSVLAHEIGHVVQHHIFRNIANYKRSQWVSVAGLLAGGLLAIVNPATGILVATGGQGLAVQNMLTFSRDFEREADRVGQKIMYDGGFDPYAMPKFFQRMQTQNLFNNNETLAFLQTHPMTIERLSEAQARANQLSMISRKSSTSFLLIREKSRTRQLGYPSAIMFYKQVLKSNNIITNSPKKIGKNISDNLDKSNKQDINLIYYGLAFAQLSDFKYKDALGSINKIKDINIIKHPAYVGLKAQILSGLSKYTEANNVYIQGLKNYPTYKGLWLGQIDLYIKSKNLKTAINKLENLSQLYPNDVDIWSRVASLYSDSNLNNNAKYHYALGNKLFLQMNYRSAIDQYQLALGAINSKLYTKIPEYIILRNVISSKIIDTQNIVKEQTQYGKY